MTEENCPNKPYCDQHSDNTNAINKHKGMWVIVCLVLLSAITSGWYLVGEIKGAVKDMATGIAKVEESAARIDKLLTGHMARNNEKLAAIERRQESVSERLRDHEQRIRELER